MNPDRTKCSIRVLHSALQPAHSGKNRAAIGAPAAHHPAGNNTKTNRTGHFVRSGFFIQHCGQRVRERIELRSKHPPPHHPAGNNTKTNRTEHFVRSGFFILRCGDPTSYQNEQPTLIIHRKALLPRSCTSNACVSPDSASIYPVSPFLKNREYRNPSPPVMREAVRYSNSRFR